MRIKGSERRKIIKEEISRMNEGIVPGKDDPISVSYRVAVPGDLETLEAIQKQRADAAKLAVEEAEEDYPGYVWKLRSEFEGDIGMVLRKGPRFSGDKHEYLVFLDGSPARRTRGPMPGGQKYAAAMGDD